MQQISIFGDNTSKMDFIFQSVKHIIKTFSLSCFGTKLCDFNLPYVLNYILLINSIALDIHLGFFNS